MVNQLLLQDKIWFLVTTILLWKNLVKMKDVYLKILMKQLWNMKEEI